MQSPAAAGHRRPARHDSHHHPIPPAAVRTAHLHRATRSNHADRRERLSAPFISTGRSRGQAILEYVLVVLVVSVVVLYVVRPLGSLHQVLVSASHRNGDGGVTAGARRVLLRGVVVGQGARRIPLDFPPDGAASGRRRGGDARASGSDLHAPAGCGSSSTGASSDALVAAVLLGLPQIPASRAERLRAHAVSLGQHAARRVSQRMLCDDVAPVKGERKDRR